jgi:pyruvate dehydrogenase phosphatase
VPSGFWSFFTVLDGHNGWQTSTWLREHLIPAVAGAIVDVFSKHKREGTTEASPQPSHDAIDHAIKETFLRLDDDIIHGAVEKAFSSPSKAAAIKHLAMSHAGSCALLAFYDSEDHLLRVAVTGDSRAVLGRRRPSDSGEQDFYDVHVLSIDQNGKNPAEEARLNALHPGEKIVENGRVIGWGLSRAFGNGAYKWSREIQTRMNEEYLGDAPRPNVKTPPYFTAEPEVTTTEVKPGDFLIMASDGLWDCLTNEEAVGLVGLWLNDRKNALNERLPDAITERDSLPVAMAEDNTVMYRWWRTKKRFINTDDNVATHLTRSALGGADTDLTAALLSMTLPRSRRYR